MNSKQPDSEIACALQRLADATVIPPIDAARETALLRAFDRGRAAQPRTVGKRGAWWLMLAAAAAALLIAVVLPPRAPAVGRLPAPARVGEFIPWPGAADLPPLESGELVRMDLPVSLLPSLGVAPPSGHVTAVKADVVIGQDGLARAVRFVGN
jgi:hypothetical protein